MPVHGFSHIYHFILLLSFSSHLGFSTAQFLSIFCSFTQPNFFRKLAPYRVMNYKADLKTNNRSVKTHSPTSAVDLPDLIIPFKSDSSRNFGFSPKYYICRRILVRIQIIIYSTNILMPNFLPNQFKLTN